MFGKIIFTVAAAATVLALAVTAGSGSVLASRGGGGGGSNSGSGSSGDALRFDDRLFRNDIRFDDRLFRFDDNALRLDNSGPGNAEDPFRDIRLDDRLFRNDIRFDDRVLNLDNRLVRFENRSSFIPTNFRRSELVPLGDGSFLEIIRGANNNVISFRVVR